MSRGIQVLAARPVLGCSDLTRAQALWCTVLGFEVAVKRDGFVLLRSGDAEVALRSDDAPAPMRLALEVRSAADALAACEAAEVEISEPLFTHASGRQHFVVLDADGHELELAQAPSHSGRVAWLDLTVDDATTSRDFWFHVGGFDGVEAVSMGPYNDFALTSDGNTIAGVCHRRGPNAQLPPVWLVYLRVADLEQAVAEARERGGEVISERDGFAVIRGPGGAVAAVTTH